MSSKKETKPVSNTESSEPSEAEITFQVIDVTPALAEKWLKSNDKEQRHLREGVVDTYASDMRLGRWKLTHQPIAFNEAGVLVDGQHRLHAVIASGCTIRFVVAAAMGLSVHDPIDRGAKRSIADLLGWHRSKVAACGVFYRLQAGEVSKRLISKEEVSLAYEVAKGDFDAAYQFQSKRFVPSGAIAAGAFAMPLNPELVTDFLQRVRDGNNLELGDPALSLRNWMAGNRKRDALEDALATCAALHYFLQGKQLFKIHAGPTSYRWLCSKRRGVKVPNTPPPSVIPAPGDTDEKTGKTIKTEAVVKLARRFGRDIGVSGRKLSIPGTDEE